MNGKTRRWHRNVKRDQSRDQTRQTQHTANLCNSLINITITFDVCCCALSCCAVLCECAHISALNTCHYMLCMHSLMQYITAHIHQINEWIEHHTKHTHTHTHTIHPLPTRRRRRQQMRPVCCAWAASAKHVARNTHTCSHLHTDITLYARIRCHRRLDY